VLPGVPGFLKNKKSSFDCDRRYSVQQAAKLPAARRISGWMTLLLVLRRLRG
jgi:hypothetical protein